jgi:hypothetical protein
MILNVGPQTHSFLMHKREHVQFEKTCHQNYESVRIGANKFHQPQTGGVGLFRAITHTLFYARHNYIDNEIC